jgi:hypothetical protein
LAANNRKIERARKDEQLSALLFAEEKEVGGRKIQAGKCCAT